MKEKDENYELISSHHILFKILKKKFILSKVSRTVLITTFLELLNHNSTGEKLNKFFF